ncbi:MAG: type II toxin-antitoxin system RelE/ParE family toxin [Deltaproteobacteria bacterium]|nr:type II toxin-antitoxin system RelE/ParE family toxin [Deltaproteobacteria bacterium]
MKVRFYRTMSGRSPVEEFLKELSEETRSDFYDAISLLVEGFNLSMPLSRNLASICSGLHELRFGDKMGQVRVFYFIKKGSAIYILHAIRKKTQEIPKKEIDLILKRIREV